MFIIMCHVMACIWIFTADISSIVSDDKAENSDIENWITANNYMDLGES